MSRISGSSYDSRLMSRSGDGSTLSLDFAAMGGTLDSRITFSRADATALASFINSSGYVTTVATAQAPRFDFDPTTFVAKGLLLEAPATNLMNWSESFAESGGAFQWFFSALNTTRGTVTTTNPTGSSATVIKIEETNTNGLHATLQVPTVSSSTTYTLSIWAKAAERTFLQLLENNGSNANAMVNLSNGNIVSESFGGVTTVTPYGTTGWYRITIRITTAVAQTGANCQLRLSTNGTTTSYTGTTGSGLYIWGAQLEAGFAASSYVATTSASVTRAVDTAIIAAGSNFSSWYTGGTTGTFVSNWYGSASSSTARSVIATSDQTTKHLHLYQTASALTLRLADFNAAATVTTGNSLTAGALTKGAFSYASTATSLCLNGGTVATGTLAFTVAPTWLSIGGPSTTGTSITDTTVMLNNSIRTLKYFPVRLSNNQIQGLTT
jgi:hypothetical protein